MQAIFVFNTRAELILEAHFDKNVSRKSTGVLLDYLRESGTACGLPAILSDKGAVEQGPPILHIKKDNLLFVASTDSSVQPLVVIDTLNRIYEIFVRYFGPAPLSESALREHFSTCVLLLDEMISHGGDTSLTDPNLLELVVFPPSIISKALQLVAGPRRMCSNFVETLGLVEEVMPSSVAVSHGPSQVSDVGLGHGSGLGRGSGISGSGSKLYWRKGNTMYHTDEVFLDVTEKLFAIVDGTGTEMKLQSSQVSGEVLCVSRLNGTPECVVVMSETSSLDSLGVHQCVRLCSGVQDKAFHFVPPDGSFRLCSYASSRASYAMPISIKGSFTRHPESESGSLQLVVSRPNGLMLKSADANSVIENIHVRIPLKCEDCHFNSLDTSAQWNETLKKLCWNVGTLVHSSTRKSIQATIVRLARPHKIVAQVAFEVRGCTMTGIRIGTLDVLSREPVSHKGCRYSVSSGQIEVRL